MEKHGNHSLKIPSFDPDCRRQKVVNPFPLALWMLGAYICTETACTYMYAMGNFVRGVKDQMLISVCVLTYKCVAQVSSKLKIFQKSHKNIHLYRMVWHRQKANVTTGTKMRRRPLTSGIFAQNGEFITWTRNQHTHFSRLRQVLHHGCNYSSYVCLGNKHVTSQHQSKINDGPRKRRSCHLGCVTWCLSMKVKPTPSNVTL